MKKLRLTTLVLAAGLLWPMAAGGQATDAPGRTRGVMSGVVSDASGTGLAGVSVKIFEEGFILAETQTEADGGYRLEFMYLPDIDWSLIAWFVPLSHDLIPEIVILRESLKSKDKELWSRCLPRIELQARVKQDVTLLNESDKLAQMSQLDCMEN